MAPREDPIQPSASAVRHVPHPANDVIPCRLDLVLGAVRPARLLVDGVERLRFGQDPREVRRLETAPR